MPADISLSVLERDVHELAARLAAVEKASSWWHQFTATALPIMVTFVIGVWAQVSVQNARFEDFNKRFASLEARTSALEGDMKQVLAGMAEMRKDLEQVHAEVSVMRQDIQLLRQDVTGLQQDSRSIHQEIRDLRDLILQRLPARRS